MKQPEQKAKQRMKSPGPERDWKREREREITET